MNYLILLTLLLSACSITPKDAAVHDFGMVSVLPKHRPIEQVINVDAPKWLWDKGIHYRLLYKAPTQVNSYALERWIAAPPELFEQFLLASLKTLDYALNVKLLAFEQQFISAGQAKVVMRFYVEATSTTNQKQRSKEFVLEHATTADASGAVTGFALLVQQACDNLSVWLSQSEPS